MIRVYYLKVDRINNTDMVRGSEFISRGILGVEGTLRKLLQDTTDEEHNGLVAVAESWRDATPEEMAYYNENVPPEPTPPPSTHLAVVDSIDPQAVKPATVTRTWAGKEYTYDCFVTEGVKDQWQQGDIHVGDFVLVHFLEDDTGKAIVIAKVFKTW